MRALYYFSLKRKEKKDGYFTFFYFLPFKSGEEGMQKKKRKTSIFLLISLTAEKEIHKKTDIFFISPFYLKPEGKTEKLRKVFFTVHFFKRRNGKKRCKRVGFSGFAFIFFKQEKGKEKEML